MSVKFIEKSAAGNRIGWIVGFLLFLGLASGIRATGVEPTPTPPPFRGPCAKVIELNISCLSAIDNMTDTLDFIVCAPLPANPQAACEPVVAQPILTCRIPTGAIQAPECHFSSQILAGLLIECLNNEGSGNIFAQLLGDSDRIRIEANFEFDLCISSTEFKSTPPLSLPLGPQCPLVNLWDGIPGNEHGKPSSGISLQVFSSECEPCSPCVETSTLTIGCTGGVVLASRLLTLSALPVEPKGKPQCAPIACEQALASCTVDFSNLFPPGPDKSGEMTCTDLQEFIVEELAECLEQHLAGLVCAATGASGQLILRSSVPLAWCVCDDEITSCSRGFGLPLTEACSVVNISDGTPDNESAEFNDWRSGLALFLERGPCESESPTATPTLAPSASQTPTPTFTRQGVATPTPTQPTSPPPTPTPTATALNTASPTATQPAPLTATPSPTVTRTETVAPSPTASPVETMTGCDSGYYLLDSLGARHRAGHPRVIEGTLFFGSDLARDMELVQLQNQPVSPTGGLDLVVLDALGGVHFVTHPINIPQDFFFPIDSETAPRGRAVDIEVTRDGSGLWVLTDFGGIYRAGSAKPALQAGLVPGTDQQGLWGFDIPLGPMRDPRMANPGGASLRAVSLVVFDIDSDNLADGYLVVDSMGGRRMINPDGSLVSPLQFAAEPFDSPLRLLNPAGYVWPFFPGLDIARDCEAHTSMKGVVILDGWGGIHPVPVDRPSNPVFFATNRNPQAPEMLLSTVGLPYITTGFDDPATPTDEADPALFGSDAVSIFKDFEFCRAGQQGCYVMDRFGGVFALGASRAAPDMLQPPFAGAPYFFPSPIAEDLETLSTDQKEFSK